LNQQLIVIGKVVGTFGLRGFLKVWPLTDFPERFEPGNNVWLADNEYEIEETQWHKKQVRIKLVGIGRLVLAEPLIGLEVGAAVDGRPALEENEFLIDDLIGISVFDTSGALLGHIDEVIQTPAHDVYRVGTALVPAVSEFVRSIDIGNKSMTVTPIPGMFEDED